MLGIQMYTVRSYTETDEGALLAVKTLKDIGYGAIQLSGSIESMKNCALAAKKCGVKVIGILTGLDNLADNFDEIVKIAKETDSYDIGLSCGARCESDARIFVERTNELAKRVRDAGFSFSYHNHSHEYIRTECGKSIMDILLEGLDKELVDLMPDTYWLQHGGADVRDFIETHKDRIKILHVKDMKRTLEGVTFTEVGEGNLNMSGITKTAKSVGIDCFIVEQDICEGDSLESARISFENLKKIIEA